MPVFLRPGRAWLHAEAAQLRPLAQAALELGEAGEASQAGDVVPEPDGVLRGREPADHRAEEGSALRRAEVNDRRADVPDLEASCLKLGISHRYELRIMLKL